MKHFLTALGSNAGADASVDERILIVDDEARLRASMRRLLDRPGRK